MKIQTTLLLAALMLLFLTNACLNAGKTADANQSSNRSASIDKSTPPTTASEEPRVLEAKWYEDADGNGVPNFIESENGYDPAKDDCAPENKCGDAAAGENFNAKPINVLLMLDSSGSMTARAGGERKIDAAKTALSNYVSNAPAKLRFGFLVYGHKGSNQPSGKPESCAGVDLLAPLGDLDKAAVDRVMAQFEPTGWTPIGAALIKAREAFQASESAENHILMVSDGIETCGGEPVAIAQQLHSEGFKVTVDVVGFDVPSNDAAQLRRIAEAGGGSYFDAKTGADLSDYLTRQGKAYGQTMDASNCYYNALISARECDTELMTKAAQEINEAELEFPASGETADKNQALEELRQKILANLQEREEKRRPLLERAQELLQKGQDINQQSLENYDKTKR